MSSLWTPGGEHRVPPAADDPDPPAPPPPGGDPFADADDPEAARELAERMAAAQQQILATPVETMVTNHVMGLYELAALHLSTDPPNLAAASLPIDAMGLLVDNLGDRLDEAETLAAALGQLRMAYVQLANQMGDDELDDD